jgi:hypothetical protein
MKNLLKLTSINIILSILVISLLINFLPSKVYAAENNNSSIITTRNLAMFASLAYADLEKIPNYTIKKDDNINNKLSFIETSMVTDNQLKTVTTGTNLLGIDLSGKKSGEIENTYEYLFYDLASTDEVKDWKIVNYTKFNTSVIKGTAEFTAITFKKDNDIVIAYRGTDFDDIGDWLQDMKYGLIGYAGQEKPTQDYAIKVAEQYPNCNIYVTGHSLGGYLAQIGGAALIEKGYTSNLKEIGYFNGMGLFFLSNINNDVKKKYNISQSTYDKYIKNFNETQSNAKTALTEWYNNGGKLIAYRINGDIVSAIGEHCGAVEGFNADPKCIAHHDGNCTSAFSVFKVKLLLRTIKLAFNYNPSLYVAAYKPDTLLNYVWITHETDSFFSNINIDIDPINEIKVNETKQIPVNVTTFGSELSSTRFSTFKIAFCNKNIKLVGMPKFIDCKDNKNGSYTYSYIITIKAVSAGKTDLSIKGNAFALKNNRTIKNTLTKLDINVK